uniref:Uncharacterized protein n=1 Tax=Aureoumbra lagunensis TaxID=44058 RepID=A0A7S3NQ16_9STRA
MLKDPKWPAESRDRILSRALGYEGNHAEKLDAFQMLTMFPGRSQTSENEIHMWQDENVIRAISLGIRDRFEDIRYVALQLAGMLGAPNAQVAYSLWGEAIIESAQNCENDEIRKMALIALALFLRDKDLRESIDDTVINLLKNGIDELKLDLYEDIEFKGIVQATEKEKNKKDPERKTALSNSQNLKPGMRAQVCGLIKAVARNGLIGILVGKGPDNQGRWALELEVCDMNEATHLKIKAQHLRPMPPLEMSIDRIQSIIDQAPNEARIRLPSGEFCDIRSKNPYRRTNLPILYLRNKASLFLLGDPCDTNTMLRCRLIAQSSITGSLRIARISIDGGMDIHVPNTKLQRVRLDSPPQCSSTLAIHQPNAIIDRCLIEGGDYGISIHAEQCQVLSTVVLGARNAGIFASFRFRAECSTVKCCLDEGVDAKEGYDELPNTNFFQKGQIKPVEMPDFSKGGGYFSSYKQQGDGIPSVGVHA